MQWTDAVLAMGVQPVGFLLDSASFETEPYPWQAEAVAASTRIDATGAIPYERVAALDPDLILITFLGAEEGVYDTLAAIAPTIGLLGDLQVDPWEDQVEVLGRALGEPDRASAVVDDVQAQVAALAEELPGLEGKTWVAANYVSGEGIYVVADPDALAADTQAVGRVKLSFEQGGLLDADLVGTLTHGSDPSQLPGWDQLAAVQNGSVVDFEFADVVGINTPTPLSIPYEIDLLRPAREAVAG